MSYDYDRMMERLADGFVTIVVLMVVQIFLMLALIVVVMQ